ncbi:ester cyclase [Planctomycetota bacterium]|nr:ester cyclase [Planctomycetota bacterium]
MSVTQSYEERIRFANDELINKGKTAAVEEYFTETYVAYAEDKKYEGHAFAKRYIKQLHKAIGKIKIEKITFLSHDENKVTWQRKVSGVHQADMKGIPASGKKVVWHDMVVSRFEGEKIAEDWCNSELKGELLVKVPKG